MRYGNRKKFVSIRGDGSSVARPFVGLVPRVCSREHRVLKQCSLVVEDWAVRSFCGHTAACSSPVFLKPQSETTDWQLNGSSKTCGRCIDATCEIDLLSVLSVPIAPEHHHCGSRRASCLSFSGEVPTELDQVAARQACHSCAWPSP